MLGSVLYQLPSSSSRSKLAEHLPSLALCTVPRMPCSATVLRAALGQEEQSGCQRARGTQPAASEPGQDLPSLPTPELAAELHMAQGQKGLGDAFATARYQPRCHVADVQSTTNQKSYLSPSGRSHSLCSQARGALRRMQPKDQEATQQQDKEAEAQTWQFVVYRPRSKALPPALEVTAC